jgi:manganese-dependent inorganic pyrophosphatase
VIFLHLKKDKNMKDLKLVCELMVVLLLCSLVCTMSSCHKEEDSVAEETAFRMMLRGLDWGTDTCYVYGHRTPDVDAVTSALAYAKLMRTLGYNCKAKVSSTMNRETEYIARVFGITLPELKDSVVPQTRLILTDHTDYTQCVAGARQAVILQKIDHHVEGDIADAGIPFVRREMVGSTATIVYKTYREQGVAIDNETARILLAGIISDTRNLSKSTTRGIDSTAWLDLTAQLSISADSAARLDRGMSEAAYDYSGMTDAETFLSDYKEYDINGRLLGFGSLACKQDGMEAFIDRMLAVMPAVMQQRGRQMMVAKIDNLVPNTGADSADRPYVEEGLYFIYYGEGAQAIAEAIYGPSLRPGVCYTPDNPSRKQIVPLITEILNK